MSKKYAVVLRAGNDLVELHEVNDDTDWKRLLHLPNGRSVEVSSLGNLKDHPLFKKEYGKVWVYCDDKPCQVCYEDGEKNNGWHNRLFGDIAVVFQSRKAAINFWTEPTPMALFH